MPTIFTNAQISAINAHGESTFPQECCGFLVGKQEADGVLVVDVVPAANAFPTETAPSTGVAESKNNRYVIDPRELYAIDKAAHPRGLGVVGIYHSHPNAPAQPSEYDREHACPWYCYIIASIMNGKADNIRNWMLSDDGSSFVEDVIITRGE